ncbi:binding-protein-dependent transport systems inner membrane component [Catenulispora acidiphila DSM 44928]|uniref:Binding-protein-dependent transport systems inner membrane component n=1 Tax=Catenulispora acidiphila (strain DSM 44928 / JCM 14897 / NBRC 102108 / NRRL B-24433 / ID139908) TaxID=479433 RepID=C7Q102_CATAD|nr:ABC transporter permease [Catenulispora acidiphila]ACU71677.1 binding-protein-dependent transport systems inner membrane component [Catenulispora acidiphila DSM 44928]
MTAGAEDVEDVADLDDLEDLADLENLADLDAPGRVTGIIFRVLKFAAIPVTVFLVASFVTFGLGALGGANPAATALGDTATPADIARVNHQFGLDRPFLVQYASWLGHALTGNLGRSYFTSIPVSTSIGQALPVDLSIAVLALLLAAAVGAAAGISAARRAGGWWDRTVTVAASGLATVPPFLVGIALIVVFSVFLKVLPSGGYVPLGQNPAQWLRFAILPALALSVESAAAVARQLRTSLVGALGENYAVGAAARGLSSRRVLYRHVLRNAAGPALTVLGLEVPNLIGGAVIAEKIFVLPGVAQLALQAGSTHDIPVVQGTLLVTITVVLISNLAVNAALVRLNPRARRRTVWRRASLPITGPAAVAGRSGRPGGPGAAGTAGTAGATS